MISVRTAVLVVLAVSHAGAQSVTRSKRGDTLVVVSQGNGKWGPPRDAVEVLRVPGDTRQTTFGAAYNLQATPDGGVVIFDTKGEEGMIVRQFDANGKFVRNLGRQGPGPGEYMRQNASLTVHPNGSVYLRDDDKSVSVFGRDGKLAHTFPLNYNNGSTTEIAVAADGSVYIRAPFARTGAGERPIYHYGLDGKLLDSISVTARWLPEGAPGYQSWRVLPDGRIVYARTDKLAILIEQRSKSPIVTEVASAPVPYLPEERRELQVARNLFADKCGQGGRGGQATQRVEVPETKLPARYALVDINDRIWIAKSTTALRIPPKIISSCSDRERGSFKAEATYEEPPVYVAFMPDGTYLGEVRFPLRARVTFIGNMAWALVPDDDDVQTLVKYRIY